MLQTLQHPNGSRPVHLGGWKKQLNDPRDAAYSIKLHRSLLATRPASADNRPICSPIEDQGNLGSCTAHMFAALVEANENRRLAQAVASTATAVQVNVSGIVVAANGSITYSTTVVPPSAPMPTPAPTPAPTPGKLIRAARLFEYYATRKIEGTTTEDAGATIRDAIKAGVTYGVADEALYPYDVTKFAVNPPQNIWTLATQHKVTSYHAIADGDIETMKTVLAGTTPFLIGFGFSVYDSFLSLQVAKAGLVVRPGPSEQLQGGHAVALVGYDDNKMMPDGSKGAFLVRNSWGNSWGLQGYFWMAQNYVADVTLCNDFWIVQSAPI